MMPKVNTEIFSKFQSAIKLPLRQIGDGSEAEIDIREDEEQSVKLQEIIDLLVAAGYFRARIKGLSSFDKVVGGMTWCIQSCSVDVDVDLLFQENSTIGQKIALTEKIVTVLQKMKCPHRIEPHQVQGLDFIHIFPVIQWLVKKSMENRQEMAVFVRSFAVNQFEKQFPIATKKDDKKEKIVENIKVVQDIYRPKRVYKRKNAVPVDLDTRLLLTLLEYGIQGKIFTNTQEKGNDNNKEEQTAIEQNVEALLNNLTLTQEDASLNEIETSELAKHYADIYFKSKNESLTKEENPLQLLESQKTMLEEECNKLQINRDNIEQEIIKCNKLLDDTTESYKKSEEILQEIENNLKENPELLKETEDLVILGEKLRNEEKQFRDHCKQELVRIQTMIEDAKKSKPETPDTSQVCKEIEDEEEKIKKLKLQLAKRNRVIATVERKIDEIPSSVEIAQYQRRFLELYNEVAAKHKETKQYYTLYNTLEDTKTYIKKELSLLNSISDNYQEAMLSANGKTEFLQQLENIVAGVIQSRCKVESKLVEEKHKRDQLTHSLQSLVDQQRRYVSVVRQLAVECKKHEAFVSQIQS